VRLLGVTTKRPLGGLEPIELPKRIVPDALRYQSLWERLDPVHQGIAPESDLHTEGVGVLFTFCTHGRNCCA